MESLDYRYFTICINKASAHYNPDGSVTVTVSHKDPGVPNWIRSMRHNEGTMCWRWYRLGSGEVPVEPYVRSWHYKKSFNLIIFMILNSLFRQVILTTSILVNLVNYIWKRSYRQGQESASDKDSVKKAARGYYQAD